MSQSKSSEQSAKTDAPPEETFDTGFSETWELHTTENEAKGTKITKKGEELETRFRAMTENGFEFRSAVKEKSARAAFKTFHTNVTTFHTFLASTKESDQIDRKVKDLIALAEKTEHELLSWLELVKNTAQAELASELLSNMTDSMKGVQNAPLNKALTLEKEKDETVSVRSGASRKSRRSNKSKNPVNAHDHQNYPPTSQPPAALDNVGTPSTCHASTQNITSQTITSKSLAGTSTPLQTYPFRNVNSSVTYQHPAYAISSLKPAYPRTYQLSRDATIFTPNSSPATQYRGITPSPFTRNLNPVYPSTDNATQIAEALAKVTQLQRLPQAKPDVFTGDETDTRFYIWETAFDALIDSAPISSQQKRYLLYLHLAGKSKKVVEQLQNMVAASPEVAYNEARKKLKSRFDRPAIIAADFENKLTNWPKIAINDAQALREYSDFLQQVKIAKTQLHNLKIFEFPSKLQTLVEKLPNWFFTKWSTKVQTLQQEKGSDAFPTFAEFVAEVTFHAGRMDIPQINQNSTKVPQTTRGKLPPPEPPLRKKTPFSTTMASQTHGESEPSHSELTKPKSSDQKSSPTSNKLYLFHGTKTHTLNELRRANLR